MVDTQTKNSMLAGGNKQKITIAIVAVIVLFVIWQAAGLFGGGGESARTPSAPKAEVAMNSASPIKATSPAPLQNVNPASAMPAQPVAPSILSLSINPEELKTQRENETRYINAVNQLQMLKIQREIAETTQAITKSKLDTVTSEKSITDLLVNAPLPASLLPPGQNLPGMMPDQQTIKTTVTTTKAEPNYVVLSVSKKDNKWRAVIGNLGKLYSLTIGDTLPADGSTVIFINTKGVTLQKDGKTRRIPISSAI